MVECDDNCASRYKFQIVIYSILISSFEILPHRQREDGPAKNLHSVNVFGTDSVLSFFLFSFPSPLDFPSFPFRLPVLESQCSVSPRLGVAKFMSTRL